jgi:23S rRNA (adenine-N6)-dimethyltransferase
MPSSAGRHELGQNFLVDPATVRRMVDIAAQTTGPLVEWGAGAGALTIALAALGRPLEAVELDARLARRLRRRVGSHVCISEGDILRHAPPDGSTVVSNVPFHLTTPVLRQLLGCAGWRLAVLLVQWEVAKKRSGVGGTTQLTAQWWPWFDFRLDRRVPATAFRPRPSVDGGILVIQRRTRSLARAADRRAYQAWVRRVFTGRGSSLPVILARAGRMSQPQARRFCREHGLGDRSLPRDLNAEQWAAAYRGAGG